MLSGDLLHARGEENHDVSEMETAMTETTAFPRSSFERPKATDGRVKTSGVGERERSWEGLTRARALSPSFLDALSSLLAAAKETENPFI